jgi:hypothetical protein
MRKFGLSTTALMVGIAVNVYDYLVHDVLLLKLFYYKLPIMRYGAATSQTTLISDAAVPLFILADFVAAFIFVAFYSWIYKSILPGTRGGFLFGLAVGVLLNIPTWYICSLQLNHFPLALATTWTLAGIGWSLVAGILTGVLFKRREVAPVNH